MLPAFDKASIKPLANSSNILATFTYTRGKCRFFSPLARSGRDMVGFVDKCFELLLSSTPLLCIFLELLRNLLNGSFSPITGNTLVSVSTDDGWLQITVTFVPWFCFSIFFLVQLNTSRILRVIWILSLKSTYMFRAWLSLVIGIIIHYCKFENLEIGN